MMMIKLYSKNIHTGYTNEHCVKKERKKEFSPITHKMTIVYFVNNNRKENPKE